MSAQTAVLKAATIRQQWKVLHLPTVAAQCSQLADQAVRERRSHLGFLEALLQAELEEREPAGGAAHSRRTSAPDEDLGRVRFRTVPEPLGAADS